MMKTAPKPKRHHYVPKCYLNNFMEGNHLFTLDVRNVLDGLNERPKENHPNKICLSDNFYTIKPEYTGSNFKLDEYDELVVETDILHKLENRYTKVFKILLSGTDVSLTDAMYLSDFIIQMKMRNPYWINHVIIPNKDKWIESSIAEIVREKDNKRFKSLPIELQSIIIEIVETDQKSNKTFEKQMQLFGLIQRSGIENVRNEKYRDVLLNNRWMLFEAPLDGPFFITSDNPGVAKDLNGLIYNTHFQEDAVFYFPVSYKYCLAITGLEKENAYATKQESKNITKLPATDQQVIQINDLTIQRINRLLIAKDLWYLKQIAERNKPNVMVKR